MRKYIFFCHGKDVFVRLYISHSQNKVQISRIILILFACLFIKRGDNCNRKFPILMSAVCNWLIVHIFLI